MKIRRWRSLGHLAVLLLAFTGVVSHDLHGQGRRARATVIVNGREAVDGEVLVRFHSTVGAFEAARAEAEVEADDVEQVGRYGTRRMRARSMGTTEMLARLRANPDVEFVEPNYIIRLAATPTDPSFGNLWGLFNVGQSDAAAGIPGADIDATLAWDVSTGARDTVVGIVDTGIDYTHPDLAANIWTAPAAFSITVGGVVINCAAGTHGFNAITNTCDPMDDHNHGTHVAGIVGAVGNNGVGVTGVNWTASMMGLKFLESDGSGTTANAIKAIEFAVQAKNVLGAAANVRVLSASWGGGYSQALLDEINRANTADMLVVAAAGNAGVNTDVSPTYPAAYSAPNVISVAATDNRDLRAFFSNYGAATVHLGAPGVAILSTIRNNGYAALSGTSVAAPHVSGAAALLLSTCTFTTASLKAALLAGADPTASLSGITTTGGRLNANNAIRVCPPITDAASSTESDAASSIESGSPLNVFAATVTPAAATVVPGGTMTFAVAGGSGNARDWLGLYCPETVGDGGYLDWKYLGNSRTAPATGLTSATITFTAPTSLGVTCNARLFANDTYTRQATSTRVTVADAPTGATVTPASLTVAMSGTMTFTVTGGPGNVLDWVALSCPATNPDVLYSDWKYLNNSRTAPTSGLTGGTITFAAPAAATTCSARFFENNGWSKLATSAAVTVTGSPLATVIPTSLTVAASSTMTFTVAGGPGNVLDWVALSCPATNPDVLYSDWKYLNNSRTAPAIGLTAGIITFTAPAAATTCSVRFFENHGWSKLATSAAVTVTGTGTPSLATVTPTSLTVAASSTMTFNVAGGPGNVLDWVALSCPATNPDVLYSDWKYLNNSRTAPATGLTAGAITFAAPAAATTCSVRFFENHGWVKLATSATVTITAPPPSLVLSPEDTSLNINTNNHSADQELRTYTWPDNQTANAILMKFDLSSVPANAVVQEARLFLSLTQSDALAAATYRIAASRVLTHNPVISLATGYTADGVTPWTPNSCCHDNVPLAQADISAAHATVDVDKTAGFKSWIITTMVQEWLADPLANFGLLLNSDTSKSSDHYRYFASMENPNSSLRPYLQVFYSISNDTTPPAVSDVTATGVTNNAATINWTTTEAATSQVEYGLTTAYGSTTALDGALVTTHSKTLSGLSDGRQYHYRVRSRDQAGNIALSGDFTFTTSDNTAPAVSVTAPAAGATVAGTVSVTANANDNVGVVGVQFKRNGANLGAEDMTAPYSTSWNTTAVADGNYTLTAVARDAAGNVRTSAAVTVTVSNAAPPPPPPAGGLAAQYPGDVGIESNPNVVLVERFDETTLANLFAKWTDVLNGGAMSFSTDAPAGSPVGRSLNMPWSSGNTGGHLYKQLSQGIDDTLYVRYYVKYPTNNDYSHNGIWLGGTNPPLAWPNPQAGTRPTGSDRLMAAAEQNTQTNRFDHYDYWMGMRQSGDGNYWGNLLLNDPNVQAAAGQWTCVEHMVKLNNPVSASNGEHAIWLNGVKVSHLGQGFPNGNWSGGIFTQDPNGSPFPGFQWRNTTSLNLNWIWLQIYATNGSGALKYAHVVAAKSYIGCLASGSSSDSTAPTVSITAPAVGATLSGTATLSANAADNVGVVGVQFKVNGANVGAEDTTAPYSIAWNSSLVANGSHAITAAARDAAGNTTTSAAVTVTVSNDIVAGLWPNDPLSFLTASDQPWNSLTGNGWNWLRRTASKDPNIFADATAPFSASNTLRMIFTTDMQRDTEPSVHWLSLPGIKEVYTGWWMKMSPNWECSPAGCGKVTFLFTNGAGQVYTGIYHSADGGGPPYRIAANTEWAPYGQRIWYPNVVTTPVSPGEWHRIEFYYRWETVPGVSGDGIIRWWVDGVLNGNHTNVQYPAASFVEFQYAPTLQNPPSAEQYLYIDHTRVRRP
jgi:subtilisin family serine protease